jgi:phosphotransferase system enzyme I (PtsI)
VIRACNEAGRNVTLCGEMAGQPRSFVLLFGMGLRSFSMSPSFVPSIKELASHLTVERSRQILAHAMQLKTTAHVKRYLADQLKQISPKLAMLDTA